MFATRHAFHSTRSKLWYEALCGFCRCLLLCVHRVPVSHLWPSAKMPILAPDENKFARPPTPPEDPPNAVLFQRSAMKPDHSGTSVCCS
jgi:hypothetical protein